MNKKINNTQQQIKEKTVDIKRRTLLKSLGLLTAGSAFGNQFGKFDLINQALALPADYASINDYKSLVCVFLGGGNDSFNMFMPKSGQAYTDYASARQFLSLPQSDILKVNNLDYGFNNIMPNVHAMYEQNNLAVISNIGSLIEPLTKQQYLAASQGQGNEEIPASLFSHSNQQTFWQTGYSDSTSANDTGAGWGGSMTDLLALTNSNANNAPLSISVTGESAFLRASNTIPMTLNSGDGIDEFNFLSANNWPNWDISRSNAWNQVLAIPSSHLFEQQYNETMLRTKQRVGTVQQALALSMNGNTSLIDTDFNNQNDLASQLRIVARMIYAREQLGMKRQIFFVSTDGYDTHRNQENSHRILLQDLDEALYSFNQTMHELDTKSIANYNSVTTFTASEFGRTLGVNDTGTDHGWGGHQMVFGGAIDGGQVVGTLPSLALGSSDDIGNSVLPTLSVDQYGATLAKWMGINDTDNSLIFPNLNNFTTKDLGFFL